jgi:2-dehydro-3-deoxy-L-rhamnonate dehydrogenase (NAD+)
MPTSYDFHDRVAVVTGGAQGIGRAIAERLARGGATVWLWDRDIALAKTTAAELGSIGEVIAALVDVTDLAQVKAAARSIDGGRIDILVNNAGISGANMPTWDYPPEEWARVLAINLTGVFNCCHAVVPMMIAQNYGRIVNIASIAGKEGNPNASHYSASKAGLIGLTKSLAKELATRNVLVNCVTPAAAKTDLFDQMTRAQIDYMLSKIPMNRFVTIEEIAALVAWLSSQDCSFSTGAVFDISGGRATY